MAQRKGKLFVISAPSGGGKTTLVEEVIKRLGHDCDLHKVITCTTKHPRVGEKQGRDYHFLSEDDFKKRIHEGFFVEYSTAYGCYYGFPKEVFSFLDQGKSYMGIVDLAGAASIRAYSQESILIGIRPPDEKSLAERLSSRAREGDEEIAFRLRLAKDELEGINDTLFNYVVINDVFDKAVKSLESIILKELI